MKRWNLTVVWIAVLLLAVGCSGFFSPSREKVPEFSLKALSSGEWMYRFDRLLFRSFPGREWMLDVKQELEGLLGQRESGDIVTTDRGLIQTLAEPEEEMLAQNMRYIQQFSSLLPDTEIYFMLVPGKEEIYAGHIREESLTWDEKYWIDTIYAELAPYVYDVDAYTPLSLHQDEYIFYRSDTRWTMTGAYYAFGELASRLRITERELDNFNIEFVTHEFTGNLYDEGESQGIQPDSIGLYHYNYDVRFNKVVYYTSEGTVEDANLYRYEYLDGDNLYGVFFGEEPAFDIVTRRQSAKNILVIGDDLIQSIAPFLIPSYAKITCVNLQRLNQPLSSFVDLEEYDQVVILESMAQFVQNSGLEQLLT